ncbi:hypothetical protein C1Y63_01165 [Corynebacterium sp. 13CS0277]|uniref:hypothetical protein n=1 Tax=Corynebacterium sp. 13CS0277 TaxID=2071994 RepID=UPI000D026355|nr:hypothetical protein [Corynebacterium sp. 13CS0277]PRQ12430.1 hypothetical protein C1Y63_01165 [Corynebacterium sp. 13CS0277]
MNLVFRRILNNGYVFRLEPTENIPIQAYAVAYAYWEFVYAGTLDDPLTFTTREATAIPTVFGVRGGLKIATAASIASIEGAECDSCGGPLTLKNRQALEKFASKGKAKCRACDGVKEDQAKTTAQTLRRAAKEYAAVEEDLLSSFPFASGLQVGLHIDSPEVKEMRQQLISQSVASRQDAYSDLEALIDAVPPALLPSVWQAVSEGFTPKTLDSALDLINRIPPTNSWLTVSDLMFTEYDGFFRVLYSTGLVYRTILPKASSLRWHPYSPFRVVTERSAKSYRLTLAGPCEKPALNLALLRLFLSQRLEAVGVKRLKPKDYRLMLRESFVAEGVEAISAELIEHMIPPLSSHQMQLVENTLRSAAGKLDCAALAETIEQSFRRDYDDLGLGELQVPHGRAFSDSFHPGPQATAKFIAIFKEEIKAALHDTEGPDLPVRPDEYFPGAVSVAGVMLELNYPWFTLADVERRLKEIDAHVGATDEEERDRFRLYYFHGKHRTWNECLRDHAELLEEEAFLQRAMENSDIVANAASGDMDPKSMADFLGLLAGAQGEGNFGGLQQLFANGPIPLEGGSPEDVMRLFDQLNFDDED